MQNTFTPSLSFNIAGIQYVAYNERVETLLASGTIHETDRILRMVQVGSLKAIEK